MKIPTRYAGVLAGYLKWRSGDFLRPPVAAIDYLYRMDDDGCPHVGLPPSAAEAMFNWETHGKVPGACSEPELLADYIQGKRSRDWHITEWKAGLAARLFIWPEEFIGSLGMDEREFAGAFGRPTLAAVVEALRAAQESLAAGDGL